MQKGKRRRREKGKKEERWVERRAMKEGERRQKRVEEGEGVIKDKRMERENTEKKTEGRGDKRKLVKAEEI